MHNQTHGQTTTLCGTPHPLCPTITIGGYWYPIEQQTGSRIVFATDRPEDFAINLLIEAHLSVPDAQCVSVRTINGIIERRLPGSVIVKMVNDVERYAGAERRTRFRLTYPESMQPTAHIDHKRYRVLEISEGGMVIDVAGQNGFADQQAVAATVKLVSQQSVTVEGAVLRHARHHLVIQLTKGFSNDLIIKESSLVCGR